MAKSHRDNYKARRKRGAIAFQKKAKRRSGKGFEGGWNVIFACGVEEFIPLAGSRDVGIIAKRQHSCDLTLERMECEPVVFSPLRM